MSETVTYLPVTAPLRDWLRATTAVTDLCAQRIYAGGVPNAANDPDRPDRLIGPTVALYRAAGGPAQGLLDRPSFRFDCWANTASDAETLAMTLVGLLESSPPIDLTEGPTVGGFTVDGVLFQPAPDSDLPRFIVTATAAVLPVPA